MVETEKKKEKKRKKKKKGKRRPAKLGEYFVSAERGGASCKEAWTREGNRPNTGGGRVVSDEDY